MLGSEQANVNIERSADVPFYRFVLTGGPCGGKTTALARVSAYLRERGYQVMIAPEVFTILSSNGLSLDYFGTAGMDIVIQNTVLDVQKSLEDGLEKILKGKGEPAVLLCDRGMMDSAAYMQSDRFQYVLDSRGMERIDMSERRYNAVFHMVTAADGAEQYYTLDNNDARNETAEQARELDRRTQKAWVGHPQLYVIDNSSGFEGKLQRLVEAMAKLVGLPTNLSRSQAKFLLRGPPDLDKFTVDYQIFEVEKVYLIQQQQQQHFTNGGGEEDGKPCEEYTFIRKRVNVDKEGNRLGGAVYGITTVEKTDGTMIEKKRIMSSREYASSLKQRDLSRAVVRQQRVSFLYQHQSFNIHVYQEPVENLCILHAQVETPNDGPLEVDLPPFLDIERRLENTPQDEAKYGAFSISLRTKK